MVNDAFGHPQSVVVLGGTSEIAGEILHSLIDLRCRSVVLAGRDAEALDAVARRARAAGAEVESVLFDATEIQAVGTVVGRCFASVRGPVDLVLVAVGALGDQRRDEVDPARIAEMITVNCTWPAAAMGAAAERLRGQGCGRIVVLSSVAAVRVRRSNFLYGAAKAGLDSFAQGLAESLRGSGVQLQVVRPGFVRTKMTEGLPSAPFASRPEVVAAAVVRGIEDSHSPIWVPGSLRWVFLVLRHLPRRLWRQLPD